MAITIGFGTTNIISIPKSDLTLVSGTLYTLDSEWLWHAIRDLEDDSDGRWAPKVIRHSTEKTIDGLTYARFLEILPPYKIEIEDGQYGVKIEGSNNNFAADDILMRNQVSVSPQNSAGNTVPVQPVDFWTHTIENNLQAVEVMQIMLSVLAGKTVITNVTETGFTVAYRDQGDTKNRVVGEVVGTERTDISTDSDGD